MSSHIFRMPGGLMNTGDSQDSSNINSDSDTDPQRYYGQQKELPKNEINVRLAQDQDQSPSSPSSYQQLSATGSPTLNSPGRNKFNNISSTVNSNANANANSNSNSNTNLSALSNSNSFHNSQYLHAKQGGSQHGSQLNYSPRNEDPFDNANVRVYTQADSQQIPQPPHTPVSVNRQSLAQSDEDQQYLSFANDAFIKSLGNAKWQNFLSTIQQPTAYTSDLVKFDESFNNKEKLLNESWGGDDRLKLALLGSPSSDEDTYVGDENGSVFTKIFGKKSNKKNSKFDTDHPKVRSRAGYWMSDEKRKDVLPTLKRLFVQNPLVPLFLRILIIIFSACALALACTIFVFSKRKYDDQVIEQQPSTIMAIVVQCCAIAYVIYISYDEYSGKPLGLRDPLGKMKLIMLDLLFIIFSSANLSLTFNTLYDDEWVCEVDNTPDLNSIGIYYPTVNSICRRQRALASFLFLVLCLWVLTFTISIIRVVDRVSTSSPRSD
ncbi:hypothetical protein HYPBUDRAFT_151191 [Hyphopichia burtonii NRRL Y-1933]|uniref:Regulator of phospholipase D SRF1 n=1 Tax=Hyphopichia burtonii NRRL Y-1933 TaxID=984485 RepID=A0A1E4RQE2_9ASCO|nr:hypothetical protein HYPBUDRAFT_151191 [Hyphopichia burtonii NRRL Y-1933]ODV69421.1 hypothetical protein HYPBUDRAFT_151191 [Hyphopichia burtonii NRRL Y-1933]